MKFTYNWLKDFVDVKIPAEALAVRLTMAGLEVESVKPAGNDFVFEVEVTSNRPDWLSVVGIAREVAALTDKKLKNPESGQRIANSNKAMHTHVPRLNIIIEDKKDCPLYTVRIIRNVKVGPSPAWIKERLESIGCRSINNIVDITNYCMFTWGSPLHAFDWDAVATDTIVVRRVRPGERLTTIDETQNEVAAGVLVIADKNKPVALAGVMGGKETEVTERTRDILLEAAVFNPIVVRRSRRALGMHSESSYRFERGVDAAGTEFSSRQAALLIEQIAGGECVLAKSSAADQTKKKTVTFDIKRAADIVGLAALTSANVSTILTHLGFGVTIGGTGRLLVRVPSWRADVNCQEDLIEEVTRIFGYEHIPTTLPAVLPQVAVASYRALVCKTKELLVGLGLQEVITYSLVSKNDAQDFPLGVGLVPLAVANPLSQDQETLRALLMPSLVRCAAYNVNQKQSPLALFEIADIYTRSDSSGAGEELRLGIVLCGQRSMFLTNGIVRDELGLLHLKGIVETVLARLGIEGVSFRPLGGAVVELVIGTEPVGAIVDVPGHLLGRFDIKNKKAVTAEIYLERVFAHIKGAKKFVPLPASPGITRDISLVLPESISVQSVIAAIRQEAGSLLRDVSLADHYRGKQIPEGKRGLTLSCFYQALKRTLTEEEVAPVHSRVCAVVVEKFQAAIR